MEKGGLVSVVIPVYNVEKYLQECVDSVLNQTYKNLEIILVDDGSQDTSGQMCDGFARRDSRVRVIHQENGGLSVARNRGFKASTGEYVYFLDSDDWIVPESISDLVQKAREEQAEVVFFDAVSFLDGETEPSIEQRYVRKHMYITESGLEVLECLQKNKEYHSAVPLLFIKSDFLRIENLCFMPNILYEDMIFTYEVFCKTKRVAQLSQKLYWRRYRANSIMTSKKNVKNFLSACTVYEQVRNFSVQENIVQTSVAKQYIVRCAYNALNIYKDLTSLERKEYRKNYLEIKRNILANNAYDDQALKMRCYGTVCWFGYKLYEKLLGGRK